MKILITGASGFIGSRTVASLVEQGHQVASLGRTPPRIDKEKLEQVTHLDGRFDQVLWDKLEKFQPDTCLHAAWITTPGIYLESEENDTLALNSKDFLLRLEQMGVNNITVLGTCLEYDLSTNKPFLKEESPVAPNSRYARAKIRLHEELLQSLSPSTNLTWARIFYPYGSGESPKKLISSLILQAGRNEPIELRHPENIVDYIHVDDVASALTSILENSPCGTINVGTGQGVSLLDLAKEICRQLNCPELIHLPETNPKQEAASIVADISRIRALGWEAETSLQTGIHDLIRDIPN